MKWEADFTIWKLIGTILCVRTFVCVVVCFICHLERTLVARHCWPNLTLCFCKSWPRSILRQTWRSRAGCVCVCGRSQIDISFLYFSANLALHGPYYHKSADLQETMDLIYSQEKTKTKTTTLTPPPPPTTRTKLKHVIQRGQNNP